MTAPEQTPLDSAEVVAAVQRIRFPADARWVAAEDARTVADERDRLAAALAAARDQVLRVLRWADQAEAAAEAWRQRGEPEAATRIAIPAQQVRTALAGEGGADQPQERVGWCGECGQDVPL